MTRRLRHVWASRSPRARAWLRWGLPIAAVAVLVGIAWTIHWRQGRATRDDALFLFRLVGVAYALAAVVMLVFTRKWAIQSLGLFATALATAGFMLRILGRLGPQPVSEAERDLVQSLYDVGATLLVAGLALLAFARLTGRRRDE